ncbi:S9 family peptidase [Eilatimonas milleporae]|uniref:Acyl-peptide hydrolase n=1 Tax=Eilatimonas milleporae TaxID=911205 RepID=A0A3M0BZA2_9PROT|nr:S9 family peptidase [Eilatimonas milleporae]RMB02818.1 dipeptidyl aminopeptidase/acylaminoacyl peptidase [Eilatimonas milleporae]
MRKIIRSAAFAAAFLAAGASPAAADDMSDGLFDYMDVFDLEIATAPDVAPSGDWLVYERRGMHILKDRQRANLWRIDLDGGDHEPLLSGDANYRSPRFSPDGTRLAYLSDVEGKTQIYVRWLDSGRTARLTDVHKTPGNIVWSPDGDSIAFTMLVEEKQTPLFTPPAAPKGARWAGQPRLVDRVAYRADGVGFLPRGHIHVFVVPAIGGTPRQVTDGAFNHGGRVAWTKDGGSLIVSSNRNPDWERDTRERDLYRVSLADGTVARLTDRDGPDATPVVSPDGKWLAYTGFTDNGLSHQNADLYVMDLASGDSRLLTQGLDRGVADPQWADDGRGLYFAYTSEGLRTVGYVTLDGERRVVSSALGGTSLGRPYVSGGYSAAGKGRVVITLSRTDRPADLALVDRRGRLSPLTDLNGDALDHKTMAPVERMELPSSFDGRKIEAWLALPPGQPAEGLPLILEIHGGPHSAYGPAFSPEVQLYAAKGYAVLYVNPRGSTSYGAEFANLIHQNYPSEDYNDLMDAVDAVIARGVADPDRLFVTGGSGGGVLSAWIIGKTDRFKAAVVAKPVINWASFALTADGYAFFTKYWFRDMPWEDPMHYWQRSPLSLVGNVSTPTMLLTGARDLRTPMSETEQYYQALQLREVETVMVQVPEAFHGIAARPSNLIQKVGHVLAWFDKYNVDDSAREGAR